jgi:RNA polymerase sigma-70 factor (ECF subfamily)
VAERGERPHPEPDDRTLVERCRAGDLAAFEPLVERYRERVWRLAYGYLRDREDAWDVAQESFVRAWQALPSFRGQSAFYTWLFRIVVNVATDRVRHRAARGRALGTDPVPEEEWDRLMVDQGAGPDDAATRAEQRRRIDRALGALSEPHRAIIMLSDLEGLSYREIAEVLDIPMGTVMSRLHNARKRLREILGPLLALVAVLLLALPVPAAAQAVRFGAHVLIAGASVEGGELPPEIQRLVPKLRQHLRYEEYRVLEGYLGEAAVGTTQRWAVPGSRQLEITPEAATPVQLRVRLLKGGVAEVSTSIQAAPGRPAVIGGPRHGNGVLIIVISPTP